MRYAALSLAALVLLGGCGTAVYKHQIELSIDDPSARLGSEPVRVSIFDHQMGYSREWAEKGAGTTSPGKPFRAEYTQTAGAYIGSGLPKSVGLSFIIPKLDEDGYWFIDLAPAAGAEVSGHAGYTSFGEYFPSTERPRALPVRYVAEEGDDGWIIRMTVSIPAE